MAAESDEYDKLNQLVKEGKLSKDGPLYQALVEGIENGEELTPEMLATLNEPIERE